MIKDEGIIADNLAEIGSDWCRDEFQKINFGDTRVNERFLRVMEKQAAQPSSTLYEAMGGWSELKAAYRLISNEKVTTREILDVHREQTLERAKGTGNNTFLLIQDTTAINFGLSEAIDGLGSLGSNCAYSYGMYTHTALACSTQGVPLGVMYQLNWTRKRKDEKRHRDLDLPLESDRWTEVIKSAQSDLKASTHPSLQFVNVGDRENENYEFFAKAEELGTQYLVRVRTQRIGSIEVQQKNGNQIKQGKMKALLLKHRNAAGSYEIEVPTRKLANKATRREARNARVEVYYSAFKMKRPFYMPGPKEMKSYVVYVIEKNPPKGVEPIEWMLLTNRPVENFEDAMERVRWYSYRWRIETFHKILKSGCKVESARLGTLEKLETYTAMMSVIAWRIQWLTLLKRESPEAPANEVLSPIEIDALYAKNYKKMKPESYAMTLSEAVTLIAKLGGFLGRKCDGDPGPTVIWRGWQRLYDVVEDFLAFRHLATSG